MATTTTKRCEGRRRMWRGRRFGEFKCGRKATNLAESNVGLTRSHYLCDDSECWASAGQGYKLAHIREL